MDSCTLYPFVFGFFHLARFFKIQSCCFVVDYFFLLLSSIHVLICCCCQIASVVSDSVRPHRWQPTWLPGPCDSPGKNTGVGSHFLLQSMKVKSESEVAQSCPTLNDLMDCSLQAPLSMGFSRQQYWSGVPLPSLSILI